MSAVKARTRLTGARQPGAAGAVIFDIDGTLLDSAAGIVAGFATAMRAVGLEPPPESVLRSDLGPPAGPFLLSLGVPESLLPRAETAYREYYLRQGLHQSVPFPGVLEVLQQLRARGIPLGTATAKRTDVALALLRHHGLHAYFEVVNGTEPGRITKPETIARTLHRLGAPDPATVVMVGDRHSDISGGKACGVRTAAVAWGYGDLPELRRAEPDHLLSRPAELLDLL